jgi:hypothetical protein
MCLPEKWRSGCVSGFPECTRIFLSPCLSVISVTISALSVSGASPLPSCWPSPEGQGGPAAFQLWAARQHQEVRNELGPPTIGGVLSTSSPCSCPFALWSSRGLRFSFGLPGPPTRGGSTDLPRSSPQPLGAERAFALGLGAPPSEGKGGGGRLVRSTSGRRFDTGLLRMDRALTSMVDARSSDSRSTCSSCGASFITADGLVCRLADKVEPFCSKKGMLPCGTRTCLGCFNEWADEGRYFDWTGEPQPPLTKYHTRMVGSHVCEFYRIKLTRNSTKPVDDPAHHEYLLELVRGSAIHR